MSSIIESATRPPRGRRAIDFGELLPRYLLIEAALAGRRVLEIGTTDARALARLHDASAAKVIGTTKNPADFGRLNLPSRSVELLAMDPGRADFADGAFDVVLVVDLAKELSNNPRFVEEVRRVLAPDGFAMFAFAASGRRLADLVDEDRSGVAGAHARLSEAVREVFPKTRLYLQTPFVGVTIIPEGTSAAEADVSLDPTLAAPGARPSHVIALAGRGAPDPEDRTLVELPFVDFEAMTDAVHARTATDLRRLLGALEEARSQLSDRERSLEALSQRIPKLKRAVKSRLEEADARAREVVSPTVLERPTDEAGVRRVDSESRVKDAVDRLEKAREELRTRVDGLSQELAAERKARREAEQQASLLERVARSAVPGGDLELATIGGDLSPRSAFAELDSEETESHRTMISGPQHLEAELERLEAALSVSEKRAEAESARAQRLMAELTLLEQTMEAPASGDGEAIELEMLRSRAADLEEEVEILRRRAGASEESTELAEARRRALVLERTASALEQELDALRAEMHGQLEVRHALGSDYQNAGARLEFLNRRLEDLGLQRAEEQRRAQEQIAALADALSESDADREEMRARLERLEETEEELAERSRAALKARQSAEGRFAAEHAANRGLREDLDQARMELLERTTQLEGLHRALRDREAALEELSASVRAREADRRAVELAAGHLSKEVETLRKRVQELRNERDTLAATSQLLLQERDSTAELARRAVAAERAHQDLHSSVEGSQAAIERLEAELETSEEARAALEKRVIDEAEVRHRLETDLERARARMSEVETDGTTSKSRVGQLDQILAGFQERLAKSEAERDRAMAQKVGLEELLRETSAAASQSVRDVRHLEERNAQLDKTVRDALDELGAALAARARTEAEAVERWSARTQDEGGRRLLEAEVARLRAELGRARAAASDATGAAELKAKLAEATTARKTAEVALGRTLEEAAALYNRVQDAERQVAAQQPALERGERERLQIENAWRSAQAALESANAARKHAEAEARALGERVARSELAQAALLRDFEAVDHRRAQLEAQVTQLVRSRAQIAEPLNARIAELEQALAQARPAEAHQVDDGLEALRSRARSRELESLKLERLALRAQVEELEVRLMAGLHRSGGAAGHDRGAAARFALEDEVTKLRALLDGARIALVAQRAAAFAADRDEADESMRSKRTAARRMQDELRGEAEVEGVSKAAAWSARFLAESAARDDERSVLEGRIAALAMDVDRLRTARAALEEARESHAAEAARCEALEQRLAEVDRTARSGAAERDAVAAARARAEARARALDGELRARDQALESAREREVSLQGRLHALDGRMRDAQKGAAELASLRAELKDARARAEESEARVLDLGRALAGRGEEAQARLEAVESQLAVAQEASAQAQDRAGAAEARRAELEAELVAEKAAGVAAAARADSAEAEARTAAAEYLASLEARAEALAADAETKDQSWSAAQARVEALEQAVRDRDALQADLLARADEIERGIEAREQEWESANQRAEALERAVADRDAALAAARQEASEQRARAKALEADVAATEAARAAVEERARRADALEPTLAEHTERLAQERAERAALESKLEAAEARATELSEQADQSSETRAALQAQVRAAESREKELSGRVDQLSQARTALQAEVHAAEGRERTSAAQIDQLSQARAALESRLADAEARERASAEQAEQLADVRGTLKRAEAERSAAMARVDSLGAELRALAEALAEAQAARAEAEAQIASSGGSEGGVDRASFDALRQERDALAERLADLEAIEAEVDAAKAHADAAEAAAGEMGIRLADLEAQVTDEGARLLAAESERDLLAAQVQRLTAGGSGRPAPAAQDEAERAALAEHAVAERAALAERAEVAEQRLAEARAEVDALATRLAAGLSASEAAEEMRRLVSRAGEAEARAERAEAQRSRAEAERDRLALASAQIEARAQKEVERADRSDAAQRREEARALEAEERARQSAVSALEVEGRLRDADARRRTLESRAAEAETKSAHAERRMNELEAAARLVEARMRSSGGDLERQLADALERLRTAEARVANLTVSEELAKRRVAELEEAPSNRPESATSRRPAPAHAKDPALEEAHRALSAARTRIAELERAGTSENLRARYRTLEQEMAHRDGEVKRLNALTEKLARDLDEARAEVGRKLTHIRESREGLEFVKRQLTQARSDSDILKTKLDRQGDAEILKRNIDDRDHELARLRADAGTLEAERHRLRALIQQSEQNQVSSERRIAELEAALAERGHRMDLMKRELAEKAERLRRLTELE